MPPFDASRTHTEGADGEKDHAEVGCSAKANFVAALPVAAHVRWTQKLDASADKRNALDRPTKRRSVALAVSEIEQTTRSVKKDERELKMRQQTLLRVLAVRRRSCSRGRARR